MNAIKNIVIILLILGCVGIIGNCGYKIYNRWNDKDSSTSNITEEKKNVDENNQQANNNVDENNQQANNNEEQDSKVNDLLNSFKEKIFNKNSDLLTNDQYNAYSKLIAFEISKIEEVTVDGVATKYNIEAKYLCENKSWNCVYYSQVDESKLVKDSNNYYSNTFYYYVGEPYGSGLIAQPLPRTGPGSEFEGKKVETKTIYEK